MNQESMKRAKGLIILVVTILVICVAIGVPALIHKKSVVEKEPFSGKIDIGGYSLFAKCDGKGSPTVVFESGMGEGNDVWTYIQDQISPLTRTFSYDRAGLGQSDKSKLERTSLNEVYELHTLLKNSKVKGPYIIVAHSLGGYNARLFAGTYPDEVAGIIFVESSHESQFEGITPEVKESIKDQFTSTESNLDELITSSEQVREIRKKDALRNIPIIVLTASQSADLSPEWEESHNDLASLSNKSKHIIVENSGHFMQTDQPQFIIDTIKEMINEVKN